MLTRVEQARRIQAAQALGGFRSVEALADALGERDSRIGLKRLRLLWRGTERARRPELEEIASACSVPYAFFTFDLSELAAMERSDAEDSGDLVDRVAAIEARLAALEAAALPPSG